MCVYDVALLVSFVCWLGVTIYFARMRACSVFHPLTFYLLFHGFVFVIRPIVAYARDFNFIYRVYQFTPSSQDKLTVILAANLGMLAFAFCCLQTGNAAMRFRQDSFAMAERNRLVPAALWALAICVPIGAASLFWRYDRAVNDFSDMIMDRGTGTFVNTSTNGYIAEAQLMLATACAMIGWLYRFRLFALLPLIGFIIFRAGTGGRGPFVAAAICLGLLWLYEHRRRFPTPRALAGGLLVIVLFVAVGQDRGRSIRVALGQDNSREIMDYSAQQKFLEGMDCRIGNVGAFICRLWCIGALTITHQARHRILCRPVGRCRPRCHNALAAAIGKNVLNNVSRAGRARADNLDRTLPSTICPGRQCHGRQGFR